MVMQPVLFNTGAEPLSARVLLIHFFLFAYEEVSHFFPINRGTVPELGGLGAVDFFNLFLCFFHTLVSVVSKELVVGLFPFGAFVVVHRLFHLVANHSRHFLVLLFLFSFLFLIVLQQIVPGLSSTFFIKKLRVQQYAKPIMRQLSTEI